MKKVLITFITVGIVTCILLFLGGKFSNEIKEFLTPEKQEDGEILNNYENITEEEALSLINDAYGVSYFLDRQNESITDVNSLMMGYANNSKLYYLMGKILSNSEVVNKENIEKYALESFGLNHNISHESILCTVCGLKHYTFDVASQEYVPNPEVAEHSLEKTYVYNRKVEFQEANKTYYLTVNKLFVDIENPVDLNKFAFARYSNYLNNENYLFVMNEVFGETTEVENAKEMILNHFENNFETYKERLGSYRYSLIKENGKISILSYEILN